MTSEAVHAAMRRAVEAAAQAREHPAAALGEFPGHNQARTASVWVDVVGRMVRLELAPGSVVTGDEEGIAEAIAEAYVDAVKAAAVFAQQGFAEWSRQHADPPPAPVRRRRPADDDEPYFGQELHEPY
jgi:hypothetical protein